MDGDSRLGRNIVANLIRGASAGLLALVLPAVLVRALPLEVYSAWALMLQIAAYIAMLDLGLQVGIGRFVARETAREDPERRDQYFFVGLALLIGCAMAALIVTGLLAWFLPELFPAIPAPLVSSCRLGVLLMGGGCAVSLPGSAIAALYIGLERFEVPAIVLGGGRLVQIAATSAAAVLTHRLVDISLAYALSSLGIQAFYLAVLARLGPRFSFGFSKLKRDALAELVRYCGNLSVWNFSMLLVSGLDTAIVAEVDFKALAAYSVCANLMVVLVGLVGTALGVFVSRASALDGQNRGRDIGRMLISVSSACTVVVLALGLFSALLARPLLGLWIGASLAHTALPIFWVLVAANCIRLMVAPYAVMLMGTGEQRWATWTALSEGVCNFGFSIYLGRALGTIGVAYGTLIGAFLGTALAIGVTFPLAKRIDCERSEFVTRALLTPALGCVPLALGVLFYLAAPSPATLGLPLLGFVVSVFILSRFHPLLAASLFRRFGASRS